MKINITPASSITDIYKIITNKIFLRYTLKIFKKIIKYNKVHFLFAMLDEFVIDTKLISDNVLLFFDTFYKNGHTPYCSFDENANITYYNKFRSNIITYEYIYKYAYYYRNVRIVINMFKIYKYLCGNYIFDFANIYF